MTSEVVAEVFAELSAMPEAEFKAMLDQHELGDVGQALAEIWSAAEATCAADSAPHN